MMFPLIGHYRRDMKAARGSLAGIERRTVDRHTRRAKTDRARLR